MIVYIQIECNDVFNGDLVAFNIKSVTAGIDFQSKTHTRVS